MDVEEILSKLQTQKPTAFVFLIGDDGTVIVHINQGRVEKRIYCKAVNSPDIAQVKSLLLEDKTAPVYLLVDVSEQTFSQHSLPGVSALTIQKLAQSRLEKECGETDLKTFFSLGRSKEGRKDWQFMFISSPYKPPLSEWVDYTADLTNPFSGIYLLPLEVQPLIKKISKVFTPKDAKPALWKFFISYNKVSGLRLVVLNDLKIVFSRSIAVVDTVPDIIAGNIEQEIVNTVEYLRRLAFEDDQGLEMILLVSKEIKDSLQTSKIKADIVTLVTPVEVATALKLDNAAQATDKFADTVLASNFMSAKPVQLINTPRTQNLTKVTDVVKYLAGAAAALVPLMLLINAYFGWQIYNRHVEIGSLEKNKKQVEQLWTNVREVELKEYYEEEKSGEVARINELTKLYSEIVDIPKFPLLLISEFAALKDSNIWVRSISWKTQKQIGRAHESIECLFSLEVRNDQNNIEKLFADYDQFVRKIEVNFNDYEVEFAQLLEKISFGDKRESIPVRLAIKGPLKNKKR